MRWKFILGLLTTCAVLMSMSYTMLIPFLPMYLIQDLGCLLYTSDAADEL